MQCPNGPIGSGSRPIWRGGRPTACSRRNRRTPSARRCARCRKASPSPPWSRIVGGLLIAAAFLAFIAANWTAIARPLRFAILLAGIVGAYGVGARCSTAPSATISPTSSVGVGSIIFGAAIALVGQMYHLGDDFAGGMLLWASGALAAAALTGSRSALAVALAAGCIWSGMRVVEMSDVHPQFVASSG